MTLIGEALHRSHTRDRLLKLGGKAGRYSLRGFADARKRLSEIAGHCRGNNDESDDNECQPCVKHDHQAGHPDDNNQLARNIPEEMSRFRLEDLDVARDAVHQLARAMSLKEREGLRVDVTE